MPPPKKKRRTADREKTGVWLNVENTIYLKENPGNLRNVLSYSPTKTRWGDAEDHMEGESGSP